MNTTDFDLDDYLNKCRTYYRYFNQGTHWVPNQRPAVNITDMDPEWRHNCLRWLERRAESFERRYSYGEVSAQSLPAYREVLGEIDGKTLFGRDLSEHDLMGDTAREMFDRERDERYHDPVAWIRTTTLYRALADGLPVEGDDAATLAERAKHWSHCPRRTDLNAKCRCHLSECAISNGTPEVGCTCRDYSPEWTL